MEEVRMLPPETKGGMMSTEENKTVVRRMLEQLAAGWDQQRAETLFTADWVNIDPSLPPLRGLDGARQLTTLFSSAFPDMAVTVNDLIAEGDTVAAYLSLSGTHRGELLGIPPTGKTVNVTATGMFRVVNGKVAENRVNFDALGMMQQLGVVPTPDQAPR
jgi:predicted ester cyclase